MSTIWDWKYYHVTSRNLGEEVVLEPRIPRMRFEDDENEDIEDPITPRVCFSTSVDLALKAIDAGPMSTIKRFIYGVKSIANMIDCKFVPKPYMPIGCSQYGVDFLWSDFVEYQSRVSGLQKADITKEKYLKYCVPDAHLTNEVWSLTPITAYRLGILDKGKINWDPKFPFDDSM